MNSQSPSSSCPSSPPNPGHEVGRPRDAGASGDVCPVCGASLFHEKCKVVCRSERCVYRIIYNCAEF